jgi:hypothetical protein
MEVMTNDTVYHQHLWCCSHVTALAFQAGRSRFNPNLARLARLVQSLVALLLQISVHFLRILQWWGKTAKGPIFLALAPG